MSQRSHLTDSEACRVVGKLEESQTQAEVAQAIGVSQSVISRIWNRFLETGNTEILNATLLQQHLRSTTGTPVSTQSVRNRIYGVGLYARRPMRERGSSNNPAFVHDSVIFGGGELVHGGISNDGRKDLYIIRDGPLTARRYRDEFLRPIVVLYAAAIGDDFILMDDNCRPHRANLMEDFLFEKGIVRM
ncbi:transposable element Tcb2 transposase [Trichonephila clavipes]|nr:transposable element Tcb2 transposase [Trichonephila clavipes]